MALICNGYRLGHMPHTIVSGALTTIHNGRAFRDISITGRTRNITAGEGISDDKVGIPVGYLHPGAWVMPRKAGRMSSHNSAGGLATATLALVSGRALVGVILGEATTSATGVRAAMGSGTAPGSVTFYATLNAPAFMTASAGGDCTVTGQKNALAQCAGLAEGTCTASLGSYATGTLTGRIYCNEGDASISQMVDGVWTRLLNGSITAEDALLAAGSAGDPWITDLPGTYTGNQAGAVINAIKTAIEFIQNIEGGRWKIIEDQMVFYAADNLTEIARFNLFGADGNPTMANVMERVRV